MDSKEFKKNFQNPPKEYSPAPLWFWYGELNGKELCRQVDEMMDKGVYQAFMHARAYLVTPYLEDGWWDAVGSVVEHSQEKGFHPWIYDEYAWPSGTAGSTFRYSVQKPSRVLAQGECNMAKGLRYRVIALDDRSALNKIWDPHVERPVSAVFMKVDRSGKIVEDSLKIVDSLSALPLPEHCPRAQVMAFYRFVVPDAVDYLNQKTIRMFLGFTHEEYRKHFGKYFGTVIPGVYFDEIYNAAEPIVWSDGFEKEFYARKGYDILKNLPLLVQDGTKLYRKVRRDYYRVVAELYEKAFFQQISQWCGKNHLQLTGHTEEDVAKHPLRQGDYFLTMRHLSIPGGDCHDYRYKYPRTITPIEPKGAVSVGRLSGRKRMMSEAMGGGGWATSLQEFKRGINVLAVMGINFFVLHGFYSEISHQGSQADWPASFFFQNPYWKYFKIFADYISRISFMGTEGKPICKVGLLYPIGPVCEQFCDGKATAAGNRIAENYHKALNTLLEHQIDADILDEQSLESAVLAQGKLKCGAETFEAVLVPDVEGFQSGTQKKLQRFSKQGGSVLLYSCGETRGISAAFPNCPVLKNIKAELVDTVEKRVKSDFKILEGNRDGIYVSHRRVDQIDCYLIVNSLDQKRCFAACVSGHGVPVRYDPETGKRSRMAYTDSETCGKFRISIDMAEDEAFFLIFEANDIDLPPQRLSTCRQTVSTIDRGWSLIPLAEGGAVDPAETSVNLELPIAEIRTPQGVNRKVRIQNRPGEAGSCGKLLSLWKARWITRRATWSDDSCEKRLFFRKTITVPAKIKRAALCVAAVNRFELHVNGRKASEGVGWRTPAVCNIAEYLQPGENLLAVRVSNDTPIPGRNVLEAEHLNPDSLTSLLLEGYVETERGIVPIQSDNTWIVCSDGGEQWDSPENDAELHAEKVDIRKITFPWDRDAPGRWIYAWERGVPPIQPWGRLSLFGKDMEFPVQLTYRFTVPVGTDRILRPVVKGEFHCYMDGKEITSGNWQKQPLKVSDPTKTHSIIINVTCEDFSQGLQEPLRVMMNPVETELGDWRKMGLPYYSGTMVYQNELKGGEWKEGSRYLLDLGNVHFHAEVWVNGRLAGVKLWKPYRFDVTEFVHPGKNRITVAVSNLLANRMRGSLLEEGRALGWNRYWYEENIDRDAQNLVSGLLGPVRIIRVAGRE